MVSGFFTTAVQREVGSVFTKLRDHIQTYVQTPDPKGLENVSPENLGLHRVTSKQNCRLLIYAREGNFRQAYDDTMS